VHEEFSASAGLDLIYANGASLNEWGNVPINERLQISGAKINVWRSGNVDNLDFALRCLYQFEFAYAKSEHVLCAYHRGYA